MPTFSLFALLLVFRSRAAFLFVFVRVLYEWKQSLKEEHRFIPSFAFDEEYNFGADGGETSSSFFSSYLLLLISRALLAIKSTRLMFPL